MMGRWLWLVAAVGLVAVGSSCVVETECIDDNLNGICDIDEVSCYYDGDLDGICDDVDPCIGDEGDDDGDGVCNGEDLSACLDDVSWADTCVDDCIPITDNICATDWDLTYCAEQDLNWYYSDCQDSCTTDEGTWSQVCAAPALAGECSELEGGGAACLCWCEDSFDSCLEGTETVQYTRDGTTFQVDCKEYCFGTCDASIGACACP